MLTCLAALALVELELEEAELESELELDDLGFSRLRAPLKLKACSKGNELDEDGVEIVGEAEKSLREDKGEDDVEDW